MVDGLGAVPSNLTVPLTDEVVSAEEVQPDRIHMERANAAIAHTEMNGTFDFI
jgi:hypothetical protein